MIGVWDLWGRPAWALLGLSRHYPNQVPNSLALRFSKKVEMRVGRWTEDGSSTLKITGSCIAEEGIKCAPRLDASLRTTLGRPCLL